MEMETGAVRVLEGSVAAGEELSVVPREGVVTNSRKHVEAVREEQLSFFGKRRSRVRVELVERDLRVLEFIGRFRRSEPGNFMNRSHPISPIGAT